MMLGAAQLMVGSAASAAGSPSGWVWPLSPRPEVVRTFEAPEGPYASGHRGADLASLPGAPVLAAGAGIVAFAGRVAGRGVVSIDHPGGLRTTYEPVAASVTRGDRVTAGLVIGRLELPASHCFPAACLHWGLRRGPTYLDPLSLLGPVHVRLLPVWDLRLPAGAPDAIPEPATRVPGPAAARTGSAAAAARTPWVVRAVAGAGLAGTGLVLGAGLVTRRRARPAAVRAAAGLEQRR